jgi:hypothetical protein
MLLNYTDTDQATEARIAPLSPTLVELERALVYAARIIEEATVEHNLPRANERELRAVPTIQTKGKKANCMAYFLGKYGTYVSGDKAGEDLTPWSTREGEGLQEIAFSAEYLGRSGVEIVATALHEMCHKWCAALGIKDCAKSGRHNTNFKRMAEYLGLECQEGGSSVGWGFTNASPELAKRIEEEFQPDMTKFSVFRIPTPKAKSKPSNRLRKWTCSTDCAAIYVRGDQEISMECHMCGEHCSRADANNDDYYDDEA